MGFLKPRYHIFFAVGAVLSFVPLVCVTSSDDWGYFGAEEVQWLIDQLAGGQVQLADNACTSPQGFRSTYECQRVFHSVAMHLSMAESNHSSAFMAQEENELHWTGGSAFDHLHPPEESHNFSSVYDSDHISSTFQTSRKDTVPWPQIWSWCKWCSMQSGVVTLHDPDGYLRESFSSDKEYMTLAQPKWKGFFFDTPNQLHGKISEHSYDESRCSVVFHTPVFVFKMLTWQVGHLIVDVLEPLFRTLGAALGAGFDGGGGGGGDALLALGVAGKPESGVLFRKILSSVHGDTPYSLLKSLTRHPIYTIDALFEMEGKLCFPAGLHLGLDIRDSYYAHGFDFHPALLSVKTAENRFLFEQYAAFQMFIHKYLGKTGIWPSNFSSGFAANQRLAVTYITRRGGGGTRALANERAATDLVLGRGHALAAAALEDLPFSEQVRLFARTEVLLAQYGSGAHNVVFLPPPSSSAGGGGGGGGGNGASVEAAAAVRWGAKSLVLLVPPGWCPWAWVYANQAVLSGLHAFVLCDAADAADPPAAAAGAPRRLRWHRRGWRQGPFETKYAPHAADLRQLARALDLASAAARGPPAPPRARAVLPPAAAAAAAAAAAGGAEEEEAAPAAAAASLFRSLGPCAAATAAAAEGGDAGLWVHLGPFTAEAERGGGLPGPVKYRVVPSLYAGPGAPAWGAVFDPRRPELQLCFREVSQARGDAVCHGPDAFNEFSTLDLTAHSEDSLVLEAWLERAGSVVPGSYTFLPLHYGDDELGYIGSGNFSIQEGAYLSLDVSLDGTNFPISIPLGEEGTVQRYLSCFCRWRGMGSAECAELARSAHARLRTRFRARAAAAQAPGKAAAAAARAAEAQMLLAAAAAGGAGGPPSGGEGDGKGRDPPPRPLPARRPRPSPEQPFYFFHLEKVGGTTLREMIARGVRQHNLSAFIPCYRPAEQGEEGYGRAGGLVYDDHWRHCLQFGLDPARLGAARRARLAVVATHGDWNEWHNLPSVHSEDDLSCFVMLRHPVARVISFYYERIYGLLTDQRLEDLSSEELSMFLETVGIAPAQGGSFDDDGMVVVKDEGLKDAGCRMLSGAYGRSGRRVPGGAAAAAAIGALPRPPYSAATAKRRLQQCTVGILEEWDRTRAVLDYWFPWIDSSYQYKHHVLSHKGRETAYTLPMSLYEVILQHNQCDLELFQYGVRLFETQIAFLSTLKKDHLLK